ncbi:MAG: outer membrane beta-barrel protein [Bacteroidales bacterium]|nr:outer membrane beta-barrel protein [Bacteroidales bacterium]
MKKRYALVLAALLLIVSGVKAQSSEIGVCGGVSFYMGDLNPKGVFKGSRAAGGILYRYNINERFAIKASALFGSLYASDADHGNTERNLSFRSPLCELSAQVELNFLRLYNEKGKNCCTPYLFVGVAGFAFNPQAEMNGTWYDLQALGTEGQGLNQTDANGNEYYQKRYSLTNFAIPFGLGFRVNFLQYYSIGIEWGFRKTFTDYIDDVSGNYVDRDFLIEYRSQLLADLADRTLTTTTNEDGEVVPDYHKAGSARGTSKAKDWYSFAVLNFTFKISDMINDCSSPLKSGKSKGLPKRR